MRVLPVTSNSDCCWLQERRSSQSDAAKAQAQVEVLTAKYATLVGKLESRQLDVTSLKQRLADAELALDAAQHKLSTAQLGASQTVGYTGPFSIIEGSYAGFVW